MRFQEFQSGVWAWMNQCFGKKLSENIEERSLRFIEESVELAQTTGLSKEQVLRLVDYVYERPAGEFGQEVGGVMVTLSGLVSAKKASLHDLSQRELYRCTQNIRRIRAKQKSKHEAGISAQVEDVPPA